MAQTHQHFAGIDGVGQNDAEYLYEKEMMKPKSVDDYINGFPDEIRQRLELVRGTILKSAPDAEESIRYGMPAYKLNDVHIYFSGYKKHIGMYPMYGMPSLEDELLPYRAKKTKDSIHFLHRENIPIKLIAKIVKEKLKAKK